MTQPVDQPTSEPRHEFVPYCTTPDLCNFEEGHFACMQPRSALIHQVAARLGRPVSQPERLYCRRGGENGYINLDTMEFHADQPTGSKQECRECGGLDFHILGCVFDKKPDALTPVLPSERSAGDECNCESTRHMRDPMGGHDTRCPLYEPEVSAGGERKCLDHCGHDLNKIVNGTCLERIKIRSSDEDPYCGHRCTFAPHEAERHQFKESLAGPDNVCVKVVPVGPGSYATCGLPREAEVHGEADEHLYPHQQCSGCGEMFETTNQRLLHLCKGTAAPPTARTREEIAREMVEKWRQAQDWPGLTWQDGDRPDQCHGAYRDLERRIVAALTTAADEAIDRAKLAVMGISDYSDGDGLRTPDPRYVELVLAALEAARKANP